ncbi:site-specific integrase, partial [Acidobacteria bacterium AH-259-O06]|nr:site-specific integrase [Acidobacteria bacterium AH-259-O06]
MKPTDFSVHVTTFLTHYLAAQRNVSPNTIKAYRDVFTLLLRFCRDVRGIAPQRLRLEQIDVSLVEAFLDYLEKERRSAPSTRNHRLAALHGFFRYVQSEQPDRMLQCQRILAIPQRRHARPMVAYLSKEELAEILAQPDLSNRAGRRDAVLLSLLYDTGARVQELIDLSAGDVRLDPPAQVRLMGKGRKMRAVPLMANTVQLLRDHMHENHLDRPEHFDQPLFRNGRGQRLSRSGIRYILQKYVGKARSKRPSLNRTVTPHMLRHTKGMHLLQSGISLEMIRDFLGHVDTKTTQIYARANLEMKRNALERISDPSPVRAIPSWQQNKDLLE